MTLEQLTIESETTEEAKKEARKIEDEDYYS